MVQVDISTRNKKELFIFYSLYHGNGDRVKQDGFNRPWMMHAAHALRAIDEFHKCEGS